MTTTVHEDLARAERRLDDLARAVRGLRRDLGDTHDVRRLCDDVDRVRQSLRLLRDSLARPGAGTAPAGPQARPARPAAGGPSAAAGPPALEPISDLPYDPVLFADADDEGVGGMRPPRRTGG